LGARSNATKSEAAGAAPSSSGLDLSVKQLKVTDGRLVLSKVGRKAKPEVFDKVNVEVNDFSAASVFPFSLTANATGGAGLKLQGKAGPLSSADASATPVDAQLTVTHLDLARSGFLPATGFSGLVSIDGTVASTGHQAQVKGNIKADELVLAKGGSPAKKSVAFDFDVDHDMDKHAGALRRGQVHIGAATASLTGTYRTEGDTTLLNMKLSGPSMPIPELQAMLPALDIVLPAGSSLQGGTAAANFTVTGPTDRLVVDGSASLNNTRLAGFDLGTKMRIVTQLAGIKNGPNTDIQNFSANVHIDPEGTRTDNISLIAPEIGELSGAGTVSASHALDFKMTAKVHTGGVLAVMGSNTNIPFRIAGTSSDPKFQPDIKAIATDKLKNFTGTDAGKAATSIIKGFFGNKNK
jgi:AsmA protein